MVRVREASESSTRVIDVDGSYLYRKQQQLSSAGITFTATPAPSPPITGWESVTSENVSTMSTKIPFVTAGAVCIYGHSAMLTAIHNVVYTYTRAGLLYTYLPSGCGRNKTEGALFTCPAMRFYSFGFRTAGSPRSELPTSPFL